jgi:hypothetical protein
MPRRPEVFVHELEPEQAQRLVRIARTSKDRVRLRRAGIVLASVQGLAVSVIAQMFAATEGYVRVRPGRPPADLPDRSCHPVGVRPAVHHVEPEQAGRVLGRPLPATGLDRDDPARAGRGRDQLAGPQELEGQPRPRLRREDGPRPRP